MSGSLRPILAPASLAVVGASRTPGTIGHEIVASLVRCGFTASSTRCCELRNESVDLVGSFQLREVSHARNHFDARARDAAAHEVEPWRRLSRGERSAATRSVSPPTSRAVMPWSS